MVVIPVTPQQSLTGRSGVDCRIYDVSPTLGPNPLRNGLNASARRRPNLAKLLAASQRRQVPIYSDTGGQLALCARTFQLSTRRRRIDPGAGAEPLARFRPNRPPHRGAGETGRDSALESPTGPPPRSHPALTGVDDASNVLALSRAQTPVSRGSAIHGRTSGKHPLHHASPTTPRSKHRECRRKQ